MVQKLETEKRDLPLLRAYRELYNTIFKTKNSTEKHLLQQLENFKQRITDPNFRGNSMQDAYEFCWHPIHQFHEESQDNKVSSALDKCQPVDMKLVSFYRIF